MPILLQRIVKVFGEIRTDTENTAALPGMLVYNTIIYCYCDNTIVSVLYDVCFLRVIHP